MSIAGYNAKWYDIVIIHKHIMLYVFKFIPP